MLPFSTCLNVHGQFRTYILGKRRNSPHGKSLTNFTERGASLFKGQTIWIPMHLTKALNATVFHRRHQTTIGQNRVSGLLIHAVLRPGRPQNHQLLSVSLV